MASGHRFDVDFDNLTIEVVGVGIDHRNLVKGMIGGSGGFY